PVLVGPDVPERSGTENADSTCCDVSVLGGEVGTGLAALARPVVPLFQRDLVIAAVIEPDLEHAFDVDLGDVVTREPVTRSEEVGENRVVEGLGAEQPDR